MANRKYNSRSIKQKNKKGGKLMSRDISEHFDEYCEELFGHTNWGYKSTYSKEELQDTSSYLEEGNVIFWKLEEYEDDCQSESEE